MHQTRKVTQVLTEDNRHKLGAEGVFRRGRETPLAGAQPKKQCHSEKEGILSERALSASRRTHTPPLVATMQQEK
jgi:hypothetical protein